MGWREGSRQGTGVAGSYAGYGQGGPDIGKITDGMESFPSHYLDGRCPFQQGCEGYRIAIKDIRWYEIDYTRPAIVFVRWCIIEKKPGQDGPSEKFPRLLALIYRVIQAEVFIVTVYIVSACVANVQWILIPYYIYISHVYHDIDWISGTCTLSATISDANELYESLHLSVRQLRPCLMRPLSSLNSHSCRVPFKKHSAVTNGRTREKRGKRT